MDSEFERRRRSDVELAEVERHRPQSRTRPSKPLRTTPDDKRYRAVYEVGALFRREFRTWLEFHRLDYTEHKGWLSSDFVVSGPIRHHRTIRRWIDELGNDDE